MLSRERLEATGFLSDLISRVISLLFSTVEAHPNVSFHIDLSNFF